MQNTALNDRVCRQEKVEQVIINKIKCGHLSCFTTCISSVKYAFQTCEISKLRPLLEQFITAGINTNYVKKWNLLNHVRVHKKNMNNKNEYPVIPPIISYFQTFTYSMVWCDARNRQLLEYHSMVYNSLEKYKLCQKIKSVY